MNLPAVSRKNIHTFVIFRILIFEIMLDSLFIRNYRNLEEFKISSLARVNLITGKNNTGKSAILEAIAIYASKGDLNVIYQLLTERGEYFRQTEANKNPAESNIKSFSSMFTNRVVSFDRDNAISIGSIENVLADKEISSEKSVSLRFVKYYDQIQKDAQGETISRTREIIDNQAVNNPESFNVGLEIVSGDGSYILSLVEERPIRFGFRRFSGSEKLQFIRTRNIDRVINGKLWDNITLTEKEQYVIEALQIIEPATERIAFIEEPRTERTAVIKLSNTKNVLPLKSMGDGINRILTIILALVNSDSGFLLIDEFENGLHHTVQKQLWKVIFKLAAELNIQVFATTHSEDCISGFENVLNSPDNTLEGKLIRLDNIDGDITQVEYNKQELKIATEHNIETR